MTTTMHDADDEYETIWILIEMLIMAMMEKMSMRMAMLEMIIIIHNHDGNKRAGDADDANDHHQVDDHHSDGGNDGDDQNHDENKRAGDADDDQSDNL